MKTADEWFEEGRFELSLVSWDTMVSNSENHEHLHDALTAFERALELDPKHLGAMRSRGLLLSDFGRHEEAVDVLIAVTARSAPDVDVSRATASSLVSLGQSDNALRAFEEVLRLKPGDELALEGRAKVLATLGRHELALASWDELLARPDPAAGHPQFPDYLSRSLPRLGRASALAKLARPEAVSAFAAVIAGEATHLEYLDDFLEALRQHEVARIAFRAHVEKHAAWRTAASSWLKAGRPEDSLAAWDKAPPTSAPDFAARASAHLAAGQIELATAACQRALELQPGLGSATRLLAQLNGKKWKVMSKDQSTKTDFVVGEFATKEAADAYIWTRLAPTWGSVNAVPASTYWLVAPD
jgi:tetratricopeptide (TPR) repeat protein